MARNVIVNFIGNTASLDAAFKRVQAGSATLTAFGKSSEKAGKSLTKNLSVPILAVGAVSGKMALDFRASMKQIETLVGVNRKQVSAWSEDVLQMAKTLPQSPKELAEALYFIVSAGVDASDALKVLKVSARASAAGLGETKVVADAISSALNAYGSENLKAARAADVLVGAVREGKAEAEELAPVFGRVIPIAAEMGVEFNEVGAGLASLTLTGNDANESATQLSRVMATFLKVTGPTKSALTALGLSVDDVRKSIREDGLFAAMMDLRRSAEENGVEFSKLFPNIRALRGFLSLTGKNADQVGGIFRKMAHDTGAADEAFQKASDSAKFRLESALSSLQVAAIRLGDAILPVIVPMFEDFAEAVGNVADEFKRLNPQTQKLIVQAGLILAAIGPVLVIFGKLTQAVGAVGKVVSFLWPVLRLLTVGVGRLGVAIATAALPALGSLLVAIGPVGWAILAVVAVIAILVVKFEWARDALKGVWSVIAAIAEKWWGVVAFVVTNYAQLATAYLKAVWTATRAFLLTTFKVIAAFAKVWWHIFYGVVLAPVRLLIDKMKALWSAFRPWLAAIWEAIKSAASSAWGAIRSAITGPVRDGIGAMKGAWRDFRGWLGDTWGGIRKAASTAWGKIKDAIVSPIESAFQAVAKFILKILDVLDRVPGVDLKGLKGDVKDIAGLRKGGAFARTGGLVNQPIMLMGEEAPTHPEFVIPTNPAYRRRAQGLLAQAAGAIGFAEGGVVSAFNRAVNRSGADGSKAELALWMAGLVESGLRNLSYGHADSTGALQVRAGTARGLGIDPMNPGQVAMAFLTRGFFGHGGAISIAGGNRGLTAGTVAQLVQGSAFPSRYDAVLSEALQYMGGRTPGGSAVGAVGGLFGKLLDLGPGFLLKQLPGVGDLPGWLKGLGKYLLDNVTGWVKDTVAGLFGGGGSGGHFRSGTWAQARQIASMFGLRISSNWRSREHNAAVGGVPNSLHTHGSAANPGAFDFVGPMDQMQAALSWVRSALHPLEAMIHDAGSGLHLHVGFFDKGGVFGGRFAQGGLARYGGVYRVGEFGAEDVYLPGGSRVMQASESGGSAGPLVHIEHAEFRTEADAEVLARKLAWKVATA